ncbi:MULTISPECIES: hypothetical protein [unclassified Tenacibaculum]|uniref:hypothetical protein n=1 Tax=unclassified Tenacibaculum TaxID=2635139 RepID=UPI001F254AF0|nr:MULTISPECIES: hypothetical protein [unclassified Tenacibaculum]MCF2874778.1 hypothetical protein [Tenacibaculum sp. Cn5-1]MCF2934156.1 hypothetical protein [Tenacibaculum sp. Cn5-34]MCG7510366.1 hypothetical protein [Tenacibaculum sp. Cn5-46]
MKFKLTYILILFSFFSCKNNPICTIDKNNAGKEIYDLDEASCFIALKLQKKKSDLNLIRDALIAEENYMSKIRLLSKNPNSENKSNVNLDINELVKYAIHKEKINLTKDHLFEIYNVEIEYLKFIGVLDK